MGFRWFGQPHIFGESFGNSGSHAFPAPALDTPADAALLTDTTPDLTWIAVPGAATYTVQIATDALFATIVATDTAVVGTTYTPSALDLIAGAHYWRVKANPNGAWSAVRSFTISYAQLVDDIAGTLELWLSGNRTAGPVTDAATAVPYSILTNRAYNGGESLVLDELFNAWTADVPDGWTVSESAGLAEISQVGTGQAHANVGVDALTGAVNAWRGGAFQATLTRASLLTKGATHRARATTSKASGNLAMRDNSSGGHYVPYPNSVGVHNLYFVAKGTGNLDILRTLSLADYTIDDWRLDKIGERDGDAIGSAITYNVASPIPGELAVEFNGAAGHIHIPNVAGLANMTKQKWAFLVNLDGDGEGDDGVFFNWSTLEASHYLKCEANTIDFRVDTDTVDMRSTSDNTVVPAITGVWAWVCVDYDHDDSLGNGRIGRIFIVSSAGVSEVTYGTQTAATGTVTAPVADLYIANVAAETATMDGKLSQALTLSGALWTAGELQLFADFLAAAA